MKSGLFRLGKEEQGSKEIDCQELFKQYWNTAAHDFSVQGQSGSPTSPHIADREGAADIVVGRHSCSLELQFSAEVTVRLLAISHRRLLITFAQAGSLRSSLHTLEGMLKNYSPLMNELTEKALAKSFKVGAALSGVSA